MAEPMMRIDKFLWFARLAKTRGAAQKLLETGLVRLDGHRVERVAAPVRIGSVLTLPHGGAVRVVRIAALPLRRGPAPEAAACLTDLAPV